MSLLSWNVLWVTVLADIATSFYWNVFFCAVHPARVGWSLSALDVLPCTGCISYPAPVTDTCSRVTFHTDRPGFFFIISNRPHTCIMYTRLKGYEDLDSNIITTFKCRNETVHIQCIRGAMEPVWPMCTAPWKMLPYVVCADATCMRKNRRLFTAYTSYFNRTTQTNTSIRISVTSEAAASIRSGPHHQQVLRWWLHACGRYPNTSYQ